MRVLLFVFAGGLAASALGCGLDSNGIAGDDGGDLSDTGYPGVVDGTFADDANGGSDVTTAGEDATRDVSSGGGDGGTESGTIQDAGIDSGNDAGIRDAGIDTGVDTGIDTGIDAGGPDACGSVEICNNGVDDNCNGAIDCADPACTPGWSCTAAAVPAGWSVVEYADATRPSCPAGYANALDVFENPTGAPASCACACNPTAPGTCETGSFSVFLGNPVGGGCGLVAVASSQANGGACSPTAGPYTPMGGAKLQIDPPGYTAGSCTPDPSTNIAAVSSAAGRLCRESEAAGGGCANGAVCAPAPQNGGFAFCISHDGALACPAGFSNTHTVGTGVSDTRGCSACTCGTETATCADQAVSFFTTSSCQDGGVTLPADSKCDSFPSPGGGGNPTYVAYEYTAQVQGPSCPPSPVSSTGSVSLTGPKTVCCQ